MSSIFVDRQQAIQITDEREVPNFRSQAGELFREKLDTLKISCPSGKCYLHFGPEGTQVFETRRALQQQLSQESGGAWVEQRGKLQKYFLEKGWVFSQIQQVGEQEFMEAQNSPSFAGQVTGVALALLGIAPGAIEMAARLPQAPTKEVALGLLALHHKSPSFTLLGLKSFAQAGPPSSAASMENSREFQVNSFTISVQSNPQIAVLQGGEFVVVWESHDQDGDLDGVFGQLFNSTGSAIGTEFQINTYTTNNQYSPIVEPLPSGGFLVIWQSNDQVGFATDIFGQLYDSSAMPMGVEFQVNTYTNSIQNDPAILVFPDNRFFITWQSHSQDGSLTGIYGQMYTSTGLPSGDEFQINNSTLLEQENPAVALLSDEKMVIAWQGHTEGGNRYDIHARLYNDLGAPFTDEFQVNTYIEQSQYDPRILTLQNGDFLITWQGGTTNGTLDVYGQLYDGTLGSPIGNEIQITDRLTSDQVEPRSSIYGMNNFVVVWYSNHQGSNSDFEIFGKSYSITGVPTGSEFQINTYTNNSQINPEIVGLVDGGFVVIWTSEGQDGDHEEIYGQRFDAARIPVGSEFRVNEYTVANQLNPSIKPLLQGGYVIVWESYEQDGNDYGVFGRCFECIPVETPSPSPTPPQPSSTSTNPPPPMSVFSIHSTPGQVSSIQESVTPIEDIESDDPPSLDSRSFSSSKGVTSSIKTERGNVSTNQSSLPRLTKTSHSPFSISETNFPSTAVLTIPVVTINYEIENPIYVGDLEIGTFIFTGGTGAVVGTNDNTLFIELAEGYYPEDGESIILFTIPEDQVDGWSGPIIVVNEETYCVDGVTYNAEGEVVEQDDGTYSYQVIFNSETCSIARGSKLAPLLSLSSQI